MRADMFEVIIERPRRGGGWDKGNRREARARRDPESAPLREPIRMHGKGLNENLAPLIRFLERRVGRPWDDVYSEIRARIAPGSAVQMHILQHVAQFVERDVVLVEGRPYRPSERFPLGTWGRRSFYVCPETGRLTLIRREPRRRRRSPAP